MLEERLVQCEVACSKEYIRAAVSEAMKEFFAAMAAGKGPGLTSPPGLRLPFAEPEAEASPEPATGAAAGGLSLEARASAGLEGARHELAGAVPCSKVAFASPATLEHPGRAVCEAHGAFDDAAFPRALFPACITSKEQAKELAQRTQEVKAALKQHKERIGKVQNKQQSKGGKAKKAHNTANGEEQGAKSLEDRIQMLEALYDAKDGDADAIDNIFKVYREFFPDRAPEIPGLIERARSLPGGLKNLACKIFTECTEICEAEVT